MGIDHASKRKKGDSGRDSGGFIALPWSVLDCPAYARLSHPARSLLMEFARQLGKDNNGRLLASAAYLGKRGWKSDDVIARAKRDLLAAEFIFETIKGHRPNKASWYAVTWRALDQHPNYDPGVKAAFPRGAYRNNDSGKITALIPSRGVTTRPIAPSHGVERPLHAPRDGAIEAISAPCSTPSDGNQVYTPSLCEFTSADHGSTDRNHEPAEAP